MRVPSFFLILLICSGCATRTITIKPISISEKNLADSRAVALAEATSPEAWVRVNGVRITQTPLKLDPSDIVYEFSEATITVIIPSGGRVLKKERWGDTWYACRVRVTLDAATGLLVAMKEESE